MSKIRKNRKVAYQATSGLKFINNLFEMFIKKAYCAYCLK